MVQKLCKLLTTHGHWAGLTDSAFDAGFNGVKEKREKMGFGYFGGGRGGVVVEEPGMILLRWTQVDEGRKGKKGKKFSSPAGFEPTHEIVTDT